MKTECHRETGSEDALEKRSDDGETSHEHYMYTASAYSMQVCVHADRRERCKHQNVTQGTVELEIEPTTMQCQRGRCEHKSSDYRRRDV